MAQAPTSAIAPSPHSCFADGHAVLEAARKSMNLLFREDLAHDLRREKILQQIRRVGPRLRRYGRQVLVVARKVQMRRREESETLKFGVRLFDQKFASKRGSKR